MKDVFKQVATRLAHRSEDGRILRTLTLGNRGLQRFSIYERGNFVYLRDVTACL